MNLHFSIKQNRNSPIKLQKKKKKKPTDILAIVNANFMYMAADALFRKLCASFDNIVCTTEVPSMQMSIMTFIPLLSSL